MITTAEYDKAQAIIAQYEREKEPRAKELFKRAIEEAGFIRNVEFEVRDIKELKNGKFTKQFVVEVVHG